LVFEKCTLSDLNYIDCEASDLLRVMCIALIYVRVSAWQQSQWWSQNLHRPFLIACVHACMRV